jgi:hypothetical protein
MVVSVQATAASPEAINVLIAYKASTEEPMYIASNASDWLPQQMLLHGDAYEHVITVPRSMPQLYYKFRIGDSHWFHDHATNAGKY